MNSADSAVMANPQDNSHITLLDSALDRLLSWITLHDFAGYEPYDLLNSPLCGKWSRVPPIPVVLIQVGKRYGGIGLRRLLRVPPSKNPKALALLVLGLSDLLRIRKRDEKLQVQLEYLKTELIRLRSPGEKEFCWGYDWDFMSLRGTTLLKFSPNCIATTFCGNAFLELAEVLGDEESLAIANSVARFIEFRLNRSIENSSQLCFSYTPTDNTRIYNNSVLAGAFLARMGILNRSKNYLNLAHRSMQFLVDAQQANGAWAYGEGRMQSWVDGFHTGYNLCGLLAYRRVSSNLDFDTNIRRGYEFYCQRLFLQDGTPKYLSDSTYPIDIHSCTQAILTFCDFRDEEDKALDRAMQVARWTLNNMLSSEGTFHYQKHRLWTDRTPYMRWGQAWSFHAFARLARTLRETGRDWSEL